MITTFRFSDSASTRFFLFSVVVVFFFFRLLSPVCLSECIAKTKLCGKIDEEIGKCFLVQLRACDW